MNLISVRANFTAPATFGPHLTQSPPANPIPGYSRDLSGWLLFHGYHNTAGAAEESYGELEKQMPTLDLVGYLWPGGDIAIDFPLAVIRARQTGWRVADILSGQKDTRNIHGQTHSLGARALGTALCTGAFNMGHVMFSAPAIDADSLQPGGEFVAAADHCESLNIFYSAFDPVLHNDYPLGSFGRQALGLHGPVDASHLPSNVRLFDCSRIVKSHGGYRYAAEYYAAWLSIIEGRAQDGLTVL